MRKTLEKLAVSSRAHAASPLPLRLRTLDPLPTAGRLPLHVILISLLLSALAVASTSFVPELRDRTPFLLSLVAVASAGWFGDGLGGLVSLAATTAGVLFFVLPPDSGIRFALPADRVAFSAYLISGLIVTWLNIHRHAAARMLAISERLSKIVVESAPLLVAAADERGNIVLFNDACERMTGRSRDEVIGKPFVETLVPFAWRSTVAARFAPESRIDLAQPHINPWITQGGQERSIEWRCYQVQGGRDRWTVGVGIDVTEREMMQASLGAALEQQQSASEAAVQATAARERFITVLAHELRNPLQAVTAWAGVISASNDEQARTIGHRIKSNTRMMTRLLDDVMDVSRIQNGKVDLVTAPVDLIAVVKDEVASFEPRATPKNVGLRIEARDRALTVVADADRLRQMLANLLSNALRFAPRNTTITVRIGAVNGLAEVTVEDEGPGFSVEPSKLFEPFWQGQGHADGIGIGLALVAQLAEMHGGAARAECHPGRRGARVTFSIPVDSWMSAQREA